VKRRAHAVLVSSALWLASARGASADGALESIASRAARGLGAPPPAAIVVSAPLVTDVAAPRGEELAARVAQLVAGSLGGVSSAHAKPAGLAEARTIAARGASLVYVQPAIEKGSFRLTVDVYAVVSNAWDRVRDPAPGPRAHAFAQSPLDAEVRTFLAPVALEHASVHRAKHGEGPAAVLAAACGDLDGDGGLELALVSRARVAVGHVVHGAFVATRTAPWSTLASRVPVPMREAIGGASIVADGELPTLLAGTTDRGGVALDAQLAVRGLLRGLPIADDEGACVAPSAPTGALEGDPTACATSSSAAAKRFLAPAARYDAMAAADIVRPDGSTRAAAAAREPGARLDVRFGEAARSFEGVGAQIAIGDLDQDGAPEIVTSSTAVDDSITVWSWDGAGEPRQRLSLPAPGGVRALCICPPEEGGMPALVAVVSDEVWIVR
jgi:hypothetical protein